MAGEPVITFATRCLRTCRTPTGSSPMRMLWLVIPCCFATGCGSDRPDETGVAADTQAEGAATRAAPEPDATVTTPGSQGEVPVTISVTAGGAPHRVTGAARCQHTEQASIY